jgi:hypothetical protein
VLSVSVIYSYFLCLNLSQFQVLLLRGPFEIYAFESVFGNGLLNYILQLMALYLYLEVSGPYDDMCMLFVLCAVMQCIIFPPSFFGFKCV